MLPHSATCTELNRPCLLVGWANHEGFVTPLKQTEEKPVVENLLKVLTPQSRRTKHESLKPQALTLHLWPRPQTASVCELLGPGNSEEPSLLLGDGFVTLQTEGSLRITGNLRVRSGAFRSRAPLLKAAKFRAPTFK